MELMNTNSTRNIKQVNRKDEYLRNIGTTNPSQDLNMWQECVGKQGSPFHIYICKYIKSVKYVNVYVVPKGDLFGMEMQLAGYISTYIST